MNSLNSYPRVVLSLLVLLALVFAASCRSTSAPSTQSAKTDVALAASPEKGGAQLWVDNCMRCHNIRDPKSLSDSEWQVAVHHMRVRANLTANEHTQIVKFLQSAN